VIYFYCAYMFVVPKQAMIHLAVYAEVLAANHALKIVKQPLAEMEGQGGLPWGAVPDA
jgi:hypothetical protein